MFGIPVLLPFWEASPNDQVIFVLNPTSTNPTLLHVKPVNAGASRASSLRLNLIIKKYQMFDITGLLLILVQVNLSFGSQQTTTTSLRRLFGVLYVVYKND